MRRREWRSRDLVTVKSVSVLVEVRTFMDCPINDGIACEFNQIQSMLND
jgi:hypothetical protein